MRVAQLVAALEVVGIAAAGPLHNHHRHTHLHHLHRRSDNTTLSNNTLTDAANSTVFADHIKVVTSTVNATPDVTDGTDSSSASLDAAVSTSSNASIVSDATTAQSETASSTLSLSSVASYASGSPSNASALNFSSAVPANASFSVVVAVAATTPTAVGALSQSVDTTTRTSIDTVYNTITVNGAVTTASASEKTVTVTDVVTNFVTATFSALTPFKNPVVRVAAVSSGSSCPAVKTTVVYLPASVSPTLVAGGTASSKASSLASKATSSSTSSKKATSTSVKKATSTSTVKKATTSSVKKATTSSVKKATTSSKKATSTLLTLSSLAQKGVTVKSSASVVSQQSSVKASSSAKAASSVCSAVAAPAATQTGIVSGCTKWVTAQSGDYCQKIAQANRLSTDTFMSWNPAVNAPACDSLWVGYAYCVAAGCSSGSASATVTAAATSKAAATSDKATSASAAATSAASSTAVASSAYKMYTGNGTVAAGWPSQDQWIDFDTMFTGNIPIMKQSCGNNGWGSNDSDDEVADIKKAIQAISSSSGVDPRFILAIIMQESNGCVRVVTTSWSVQNPGLMQDHAGSGTCNSGGVIQDPCPYTEIEQMIKDGTEGTSSGDGLVQVLTQTGASDVSKYYRAARIYNGGINGYHADDLGSGCCTLCYSSDVANRLTGWNTGVTGCTLKL